MDVRNVTIFCESTVLKLSFSNCKLCLTLSYFYFNVIFLLLYLGKSSDMRHDILWCGAHAHIVTLPVFLRNILDFLTFLS